MADGTRRGTGRPSERRCSPEGAGGRRRSEKDDDGKEMMTEEREEDARFCFGGGPPYLSAEIDDIFIARTPRYPRDGGTVPRASSSSRRACGTSALCG